MPSKLTTLITSLVFVITSFTFANAAELNVPGFTGSANTTVTTGFSARIERNCESVRGYKRIDDSMRTYVNNGGYAGVTIAEADRSAYLQDGEGCAPRRTDGYGNRSNSPRDLTSENADDGNMNFDGGDIFDATTRVYTEITGKTDAGVGVNLSLVGSYNAIDSFTSPTWRPFTAAQLDNIETNVELLNAYVTSDLNDDLSFTAGRFVTNWGESTFIPVGMNGLTTNALDLGALRKPGASIKESLIPTEQITLSGYLDGGWSFEAYYQLGESHLELDEAGTFFGSEVASDTGNRLIFSAPFGDHTGDARNRACGYLLVTSLGGCTATNVATFNTTAGKLAQDMYLFQAGLNALYAGDNAAALVAKGAVLGGGAAATFGGSAGDVRTLATHVGSAGVAGVIAGFQNWDEYTKKAGGKIGVVDLAGNGHIHADGEEQFGIALRTYLDDVGSGVDLGFYFSQFDSKVPYLRYKGQQGIHAGDLFGAFQLAASGDDLAARLDGSAANFESTGDVTLTESETAAITQIVQGLGNVSFNAGACGAYMNPHLAHQVYGKGTATNFAYTSEEKANALDALLYTNINGKLYFDASKCATLAGVYGRTATLQGAGALLGAAVFPLNLAEYEFIYPENLQAMGVSMNTNVGATTVQAELTYRPNFPLHTAPADQGQQLSDAAGSTMLLTMGVIQGMAGDFAAALSSYASNVEGATFATAKDMITAAGGFKRSYLPAISLATVAAGDYYTTPYFEYDVLSGTIGTTSSFSASHPITAGLQADSAALVTELGFVHVDGLTQDKPINRGGYRDGVGGVKCGGINNAGPIFNAPALKILDGATHLASAQTDPLFGNGSYCEPKNNADDLSMTYRIVGVASYNNFNNSSWTFSPSFVWSHDFSGYGPTTLGGFVPGRQSLSLTGNMSKGDTSFGLSYVNQLGDPLDNLAFDRDYISANVSYAF